jgi:nickel-dependent lactate racemase
LANRTLAYGHSTQIVSLPRERHLWLDERDHVPPEATEEELVQRALNSPLGRPRLSTLARAGQQVVIIVSDITRPCPTSRLLPALLSEVYASGVDQENIRIVFGLGSHRCLTSDEQAQIVGEDIFAQIHCGDIGTGPFVELGRTSRGTPVEVFRAVAEADLRVLVGNIEYHYFAGYTGGVKAVLPGVCSVETVRANHSWMVEDSAVAGRIEGNPVREDLEEAATLVEPAFLLNVVLDGQKHIVHAVAGDVTLAHREGCRKVDELYRVPIKKTADIVLASAGGWPKDINLYQAHKALENAARAVRDGGTIILVAKCEEGIGQARFAEWLTCGDPPDEILRRINQHFVLGGHKAAAIAKIRRRGVRLLLVSDLDKQTVRAMGWVPHKSAQEALSAAQNEMGREAVIALMPHAGSTLPVLAQS